MAATVEEEGTRRTWERRRWRALVVLSVGQLMVVLDSTVVNVALPTIQRDLHFSQASLAWVVNSYLITFGGLLLLGGRLGDLIGRKRIFLIGLAAFSATSMLCGIAPSAGVLVGARFLQGASAALMSSMVLGTLSPMFPDPKERTKALNKGILQHRLSVGFGDEEAIQPHSQRFGDFLERAEARGHLSALNPGQIGPRDA